MKFTRIKVPDLRILRQFVRLNVLTTIRASDLRMLRQFVRLVELTCAIKEVYESFHFSSDF